MTLKQNRRTDGIKQPYLPLPSPIQPQKFRCIQITIPDYDDWELQLRTVFRRYLGLYSNFGWNDNQEGAKVAKIWRKVETTIRDCTQAEEETPDEDCGCDDQEGCGETVTAACLQPFVGQIAMGIQQPAEGWLLCNGQYVNKAAYPVLYGVLAGKTPETAEEFSLPDFDGWIPMGAGGGGAQLDVLEKTGALTRTLTTSNMPAHSHNVGAHQHTVYSHSHTVPAHSHTVGEHVHQVVGHSHSVTIPDHQHGVGGRDNSSGGTANRFVRAGAAGTVNDSSLTDADGGGTFNTSSHGAANTNPNTPFATSEQGVQTTSTHPDLATSSAGGGGTSNEGGGQSFSILNPVIGIHFFIFAGCESESECG